MDERCDLLLFVATETESAQLQMAAKERGLSFDRIETGRDQGESYRIGLCGQHRIIAVKTRMGALGHGGSAGSAFRYTAKTGATSIVCLGMAFGISRETQAFGDVLVASSVFPYDNRDVMAFEQRWKYEYSAQTTPYRTNPELFKILDTRRKHVSAHRVLPGCLLTGSARIRCQAYRDNLVSWCTPAAPGIVGGEMEGFGLLALTPKSKPNWIIVKGICDFADGDQQNDAEANRALACGNAARFVLDALGSWKPGARESTRSGGPDDAG